MLVLVTDKKVFLSSLERIREFLLIELFPVLVVDILQTTWRQRGIVRSGEGLSFDLLRFILCCYICIQFSFCEEKGRY